MNEEEIIYWLNIFSDNRVGYMSEDNKKISLFKVFNTLLEKHKENQQLKSVLNEVREYITKECPWYKDAGVSGTRILKILDKVGDK